VSVISQSEIVAKFSVENPNLAIVVHVMPIALQSKEDGRVFGFWPVW